MLKIKLFIMILLSDYKEGWLSYKHYRIRTNGYPKYITIYDVKEGGKIFVDSSTLVDIIDSKIETIKNKAKSKELKL